MHLKNFVYLTSLSTHPSIHPYIFLLYTLTFSFVLEKLLGAELEDVVQLLFGHGAGLGAQPWPHHQVGQHHLTFGYLGNPFLDRRTGHKPIDHHLICLTDPMGPTECLRERKGDRERNRRKELNG